MQGWKEHGKCGTEEGSEGIFRKERRVLCLEHGRRDFEREGRRYAGRESGVERRKDLESERSKERYRMQSYGKGKEEEMTGRVSDSRKYGKR